MGRKSAKTADVDGERLELLIKQKNTWTSDLAKRAGVSEGLVRKMLKGGTCEISNIKRVADALGVESRELLEQAEGLEQVVSTPPDSGKKYCYLQIRLSIPYEEFDQTHQLARFIQELKVLIAAQSGIEVGPIEDGSTIVTLRMEEDDVIRLMRAFVLGQLKKLKVAAIRVEYEYVFVEEVLPAPEPYPDKNPLQKVSQFFREAYYLLRLMFMNPMGAVPFRRLSRKGEVKLSILPLSEDRSSGWITPGISKWQQLYNTFSNSLDD